MDGRRRAAHHRRAQPGAQEGARRHRGVLGGADDLGGLAVLAHEGRGACLHGGEDLVVAGVHGEHDETRRCRSSRGWRARRRGRARRAAGGRSPRRRVGARASAVTPSATLPAWPTTLMSSSRSKARARPWRISSWSSTSSTVVLMGALSFVGCGRGRPQGDDGSAAGSGCHVERGADARRPARACSAGPSGDRAVRRCRPRRPRPRGAGSCRRSRGSPRGCRRARACGRCRSPPARPAAPRWPCRGDSGGPDSSRDRCTRRPVAWLTSRA